MEKMKISELWVYPIKSCCGIQLESATINSKGLEMDRRWMLIDQKGKMISQREHQIMSQIFLIQKEEGYLIGCKGAKDIFLSFNPYLNETVQATIWDDTVEVGTMDERYNKWFSNILKVPCQLVFIDEKAQRPTRKFDVGLADAQHSLIVSETAVRLLNDKLEFLGIKITSMNFRPNIVFAGGYPHIEDDWAGKDFLIGNVLFSGRKSCGRCKIITINPQTSIAEPNIMKTLNSYRFREQPEKGIYFGLRLSTQDVGKTISIGDEILI